MIIGDIAMSFCAMLWNVRRLSLLCCVVVWMWTCMRVLSQWDSIVTALLKRWNSQTMTWTRPSRFVIRQPTSPAVCLISWWFRQISMTWTHW